MKEVKLKSFMTLAFMIKIICYDSTMNKATNYVATERHQNFQSAVGFNCLPKTFTGANEILKWNL